MRLWLVLFFMTLALSVWRSFWSTNFAAAVSAVDNVTGERKVPARRWFSVVGGSKVLLIFSRRFCVVNTSGDRFCDRYICVRRFSATTSILNWLGSVLVFDPNLIFRRHKSCLIFFLFGNLGFVCFLSLFGGCRGWISSSFSVLCLR